jgi:hypothetical protein
MIRNVLPVTTAGMANTTMKAVTNCAHTNSGMRFSDMPGARCLITVAMISTATARAATSVKVMV